MPNKSRQLIILCLTLCIVISGCQNKKPKAPINDWKNINLWSFKGKMAIINGNESNSATVKWVASKNKTQASFRGPLWFGSLKIIETDKLAKLTSSKTGEKTAKNAEQLISNELGWHFPWNSLQYWLRGHKSNQTIQTITQEKSGFSDGDWNISYTKWTPTPFGLLPKKIKASKPPYTVKLVIYNWGFE